MSAQTIELISKRLELFKKLVPGLKRVLLVYDPSDADAIVAPKRIAMAPVNSARDGGEDTASQERLAK